MSNEYSLLMFPTILCQLFNVCTRQAPPVISADSMGNTIALLGQDVDFTCKVDNLGRHMVAFVRAGKPPRLISFDERIFRQRDKYELKPRMGPMNNEWVLTIKNAQEKDRGNYSCQINTDPVMSMSGELDIRVPPSVSRNTPSAIEVREGHNATLSCKAEGNPAPTVIWRRQDRQIIRYNGATGFGASVFHGPNLQLTKVSRKHMSEYVCVASNGIPPDESYTIKLLVTFAPLVIPKETDVKASTGSMARLVCTAESWPRPEVTWEKDGKQIFDSDDFATSQTVSGQYHSVHVLEIRKVTGDDYGTYRCSAKNDNGAHYADINLEAAQPEYIYTNVIPEDRELATRETQTTHHPSNLQIKHHAYNQEQQRNAQHKQSHHHHREHQQAVYYVSNAHPQPKPSKTELRQASISSSSRWSVISCITTLLLCIY
ncbi:unnamed protein product [Auanema sp. JU1783]|nr:unnamed protein product [Auanema sp. JU1783]